MHNQKGMVKIWLEPLHNDIYIYIYIHFSTKIIIQFHMRPLMKMIHL